MAVKLSSIQRTSHESPPRIIIYGPEGVGKSTFFAGGKVVLPDGSEMILRSAPAPIFIRTEDGLRGLDVDAFPVAQSYDDVIEALDTLLNEPHEYQTVVLDSADWLESLIFAKVCEENRATDIDKVGGGYGKGKAFSIPKWEQVLKKLDRLNIEKTMIVGIICHANIIEFRDPEAEPYHRYEMKLFRPKDGRGARDMLLEWADVIGFANRKTVVAQQESSDQKSKLIKARQMSGLTRLNLIGAASYIAKNRYNLPSPIDLSWDAFGAELMASWQGMQPTPQIRDQ